MNSPELVMGANSHCSDFVPRAFCRPEPPTPRHQRLAEAAIFRPSAAGADFNANPVPRLAPWAKFRRPSGPGTTPGEEATRIEPPEGAKDFSPWPEPLGKLGAIAQGIGPKIPAHGIMRRERCGTRSENRTKHRTFAVAAAYSFSGDLLTRRKS
jgi:hypothetical protein